MYAICRKHAAPTEETPSRAYHRKLKLLAPGIEDGERGVGNITNFMFRGHTKLEMELTTENISDPQEGCTGFGQIGWTFSTYWRISIASATYYSLRCDVLAKSDKK